MSRPLPVRLQKRYHKVTHKVFFPYDANTRLFFFLPSSALDLQGCMADTHTTVYNWLWMLILWESSACRYVQFSLIFCSYSTRCANSFLPGSHPESIYIDRLIDRLGDPLLSSLVLLFFPAIFIHSLRKYNSPQAIISRTHTPSLAACRTPYTRSPSIVCTRHPSCVCSAPCVLLFVSGMSSQLLTSSLPLTHHYQHTIITRTLRAWSVPTILHS
jgi:hypothetical protein